MEKNDKTSSAGENSWAWLMDHIQETMGMKYEQVVLSLYQDNQEQK